MVSATNLRTNITEGAAGEIADTNVVHQAINELTALALELIARNLASPYVIYFNSATRTFPQIPSPRPVPVITFSALKDPTFNPATEMPTILTHTNMLQGDEVAFFYPPA